MDCFCVLCKRCYATLGAELLYSHSVPQISESYVCNVCDSPTEFENENLSSLNQSHKLYIVANRYLANMYARLKKELTVKQIDSSAELDNRVKELSTQLSRERKKNELCMQLLKSLKSSFKIQIADVSPTFYFQDKFRILTAIFSEPPKKMAQPAPNPAFDSVKQKERKMLAVQELAETERIPRQEHQKNPLIPDIKPDNIFSFSAFKNKQEHQSFDNKDNKENRAIQAEKVIQNHHFDTPHPPLGATRMNLQAKPQNHNVLDSQMVSEYVLKPVGDSRNRMLITPKGPFMDKLHSDCGVISQIEETEQQFDMSKDSMFGNHPEDLVSNHGVQSHRLMGNFQKPGEKGNYNGTTFYNKL